jgi:hypothetical protein
VPSSIAKLGYELSLKAIEEQESRLGDLRGRAGTLLAAASIAASFLGGQSIRAGDLSIVGALALVAYLVCVGACIKVLLPHRLVLAFRGSVLVKAAREAAVADVDEALVAAMDWIERFVDGNRGQLDQLGRWYTIACLALGTEIVLWVV